MVTAYGTIPGAVEAIRSGAFEYITKPFRNERLLDVVRRAVSRHQAGATAATAQVRGAITSVMGHGSAVQLLVDQIETVIATDYSVLIRGETGAGKEVVARCLHEKGPRADHPLVVVDCGSVVDTLIDSEFFGHEKGAYAGAANRRLGWFETAAKGGTLFLDEIGNLSAMGQKALLRALEERVIHRVGSTTPISIDVRVIAATNEALEEHRPRRLPRRPVLPARRVCDRAAAAAGAARGYRFPGGALSRPGTRFRGAPQDRNRTGRARTVAQSRLARQCARTAQRSRHAALVATEIVTVAQIAGCLTGHRLRASPPARSEPGSMALRGRVRDKVREVERDAIIEALERAGGNKAEAARQLGIDYKTYRTKLKIVVERGRAEAHGQS
jgi:DNA-binding NtrC family response regulator